MQQYTNYVCGFLFSENRKQILLIQKLRPRWQLGFLNGIGGKIEEGETPLEAMNREFFEETGVNKLKWEVVSVLNGRSFSVSFFAAFDDAIYNAFTKTDETVAFFDTKGIFDGSLNVIRNMPLMVSLCLDSSGILKPVFFQDISNLVD